MRATFQCGEARTAKKRAEDGANGEGARTAGDAHPAATHGEGARTARAHARRGRTHGE